MRGEREDFRDSANLPLDGYFATHIPHEESSSSKAFASVRSLVPKPSVNHA